MQHPLAGFLTLAGGDNHAGIWHGNPDTGHQFGKNIVVNGIGKRTGIDIIGGADPGNADGVRADAVDSFQMLSVH